MKIKKLSALILSLIMCISFGLLNMAAAADAVTFEAVYGYGKSSSNEGYSKLIDGNTSTKWGSGFSSGDKLYIVIKASSAIVLKGYSLTTANDNSTIAHRYLPAVFMQAIQ